MFEYVEYSFLNKNKNISSKFPPNRPNPLLEFASALYSFYAWLTTKLIYNT